MELINQINEYINESDQNFWLVVGASSFVVFILVVLCCLCYLGRRKRNKRRQQRRTAKGGSRQETVRNDTSFSSSAKKFETEIAIIEHVDDISTIGEPSVFGSFYATAAEEERARKEALVKAAREKERLAKIAAQAKRNASVHYGTEKYAEVKVLDQDDREEVSSLGMSARLEQENYLASLGHECVWYPTGSPNGDSMLNLGQSASPRVVVTPKSLLQSVQQEEDEEDRRTICDDSVNTGESSSVYTFDDNESGNDLETSFSSYRELLESHNTEDTSLPSQPQRRDLESGEGFSQDGNTRPVVAETSELSVYTYDEDEDESNDENSGTAYHNNDTWSRGGQAV